MRHAEAVNYAQVVCERKLGVDPVARDEPGRIWRMTSDRFFAVNRETFDLIFIDGDHETAQVDRDIAGAMGCLNRGGCVVLHDCLPPSEWHQRPSSRRHEGGMWMGTVWRSALEYFERGLHRCFVVDCDCGCGVIDTARASERAPAPATARPVEDFARDFPRLMTFVISPDQLVQYFVTPTA